MNHSVSPAAREQIASLVLKLQFGLLVIVGFAVARWVSIEWSLGRVFSGLLLLMPLLLPLRGFFRRERRTYAWATLCLLPYIVVGITELTANPARRDWAIGCLVLSLAAFIACIAYLRVTRGASDEATTSSE